MFSKPFSWLLIGLTLLLSACSPAVSGPGLPTASFPPTAAPGEVAATQAPAAQPLPAVVSGSLPPGLLLVYPTAGGLRLQTGSAAPLALTDNGLDANPRLASAGQWVVFQRGAELWWVSAAGGEPQKIFGETGVAPLQFDFAPASQSVYFTTADSSGAPRFDLNRAEGGAARVLLPAGQGGQFTFSSDGQTLALVQPAKISVVRADGSGVQVLSQFKPAGELLPPVVWLENGYGFKTVLPATGGQPARFLFLMAAGGPEAQLALFPASGPVFIAPDGSKVLYTQLQGDQLEVHLIDASTADKFLFAYQNGSLGLLGWTPDSKSPLFWLDHPANAWIAPADQRAPLSDVASVQHLVWLDAESFLFLSGTDLRLGRPAQPSQILVQGVTGPFTALVIR